MHAAISPLQRSEHPDTEAESFGGVTLSTEPVGSNCAHDIAKVGRCDDSDAADTHVGRGSGKGEQVGWMSAGHVL